MTKLTLWLMFLVLVILILTSSLYNTTIVCPPKLTDKQILEEGTRMWCYSCGYYKGAEEIDI